MNLNMNLEEKVQRGEVSFNDFIQNEMDNIKDKGVIAAHMEIYGRYSFENRELETGHFFMGIESLLGPFKTIMLYTIKDKDNCFVSIELYTPDGPEDLIEYKIEVLNRSDIESYLKEIENSKGNYVQDTFETFKEGIELYMRSRDAAKEGITEDKRFKYIATRNRESVYRSKQFVNLIVRSINKRFKEYRHNNLVIRDMKEKEEESLNRGIEHIYLEFKDEYMYLNMKDHRVNLSEEEFYILHRGGKDKISNMRFIEYIMNLDRGGFKLKEVMENGSLIEKEGEEYFIKHKDVSGIVYDKDNLHKRLKTIEEDVVKEEEVDYITEHLKDQEGQLNLLGLI